MKSVILFSFLSAAFSNRLILIMLIVVLCSLSCKKNKVNNSVLPDVTQQGKNTVGFDLNNEVWTPHYMCRTYGNPCGELQVSYDISKGYLDFSMSREINGIQTSLSISSPNGSITSPGNKIDSVEAGYIDGSNSYSRGIYFILLPGSTFNITKLDTMNKIISGNFNLLLSEHLPDGGRIELKKWEV